LSSSPTEPSPSSAHTATPASTSKQPLREMKDDLNPPASVPTGHQHRETEMTPDTPKRNPECTSSYIRMVNNPDETQTERPPTVVSGQIWRSGSKGEGWRRHQWATDIG
jgi:hypothetical protein